MSSGRRYETGPSLEDDRASSDTDGDGTGENESNERSDGRRQVLVAPWKAGAASGVSAFALVFLVSFQLVGVMFAGGLFRAESQPSRWIATGWTMLASHGATVEIGEETIRGGFGTVRSITSHVTALVPVIVLLVAGYLVVRYVRLETRREAGIALGSFSVSYLALAVGLSMVATWTPEGADAETISVPTDWAMLLTTAGTVVAFVAIGAAVAALPRLLEAGPFELVDDAD